MVSTAYSFHSILWFVGGYLVGCWVFLLLCASSSVALIHSQFINLLFN